MSDKDLVQRRKPDELRYLKKHIAQIRADERVSSAAAAHSEELPVFTLVALQNGVFIDGHPCRLTVGTIALLRATRSRCIGYGKKEDGPLSDLDIAQGVFLLSDETRGLAISCADDPDELAKELKRFKKQLNCNRAAVELHEFLRRHSEAMFPYKTNKEQEEEAATEDESFWQAPDDAWADDVDLLASEYGWSDHDILWVIPLLRVLRCKESINARRTGKARTSRRDKTGIEFLKVIEDVGKELHASG